MATCIMSVESQGPMVGTTERLLNGGICAYSDSAAPPYSSDTRTRSMDAQQPAAVARDNTEQGRTCTCVCSVALQRQCHDSKNARVALAAASRAGRLDLVRALVEQAECGATNDGPHRGLMNPHVANTALWEACAAGHAAIVRYLAAHGADVEAPDSRGDTPLVIATVHGHAGAVQTLLECGANPLGTVVVTSARDVAERLGNIGILRLLDAGLEVQDCDDDDDEAQSAIDSDANNEQ